MSSNLTNKQVDFESALGERYLSYALSTIMSRSLPDVRDGLKPVHRRLLYAMLQLKLDPKTGHKKCARIVGDVIGKYHPHGEVAVYDALVRMAQVFASRYPLINGQGNFGSIDGDNQAAMRYTEAKLTEYATLLLKDIESNTVNFKPNYDGSDSEPLVLPASVPNLLANGTEGIAVGMATSVPPHNIIELLDATALLLENPDAEINSLLKKVKGPDFPTGGILIEPPESIAKSYNTGRGSFRLRAKWEVEELERGQYQIIIKEIPYQVQKRAIIEKLAELYQEKQIPFLDNFQDLSAEDIRIVLIPKSRNIDAKVIMEHLFKLTDLEVKIQLNMNVLNASSLPMVMNLKQVLEEFINHRHEVIIRRLKNRLSQVVHRLEILEGLLIVYLNLDEVIRIIREEDEAKTIMMDKWKLTDVQAEAILNTRLRSLRKLEEFQIKSEHKSLSHEKAEIEKNLASNKNIRKVVSQEIAEIRKLLAKDSNNRRRTEIGKIEAHKIPEIEQFIEKEAIVVTCSEFGWLKAIKGSRIDSIKYKEGDREKYVIEAYNTDKLLVFTDYGKFYTLPCDKISRGKGDGEPIRIALNMDTAENIITIMKYEPENKLLLASRDGRGFIVKCSDVLAQTKGGRQVMTCESGRAFICKSAIGHYVITVGENRRLLVFDIKEIPEMKKGRGVTLQKFKDGLLKELEIAANLEELERFIPSGSHVSLWRSKRASLGRLVIGKIWSDK